MYKVQCRHSLNRNLIKIFLHHPEPESSCHTQSGTARPCDDGTVLWSGGGDGGEGGGNDNGSGGGRLVSWHLHHQFSALGPAVGVAAEAAAAGAHMKTN